MPSIYISPSTQEHNVGKGDYGTEEKRMNQVADVVVRELARHGVIVYRNGPEMTLQEVVADSNTKRPDLHFSIHSNAGGGRGAEIYCCQFGGRAEVMAQNVYKYLEPLTPVADRGIKTNNHLMELNSTKAPSVLVEIDYHDSTEGAAWIEANIEPIGVALAKGLLDTLGIAWKDQEKDAYAKDREWAIEQGISDGSDPDRPVLRKEVWAMLRRMKG